LESPMKDTEEPKEKKELRTVRCSWIMMLL
jgi:hypothetical protein